MSSERYSTMGQSPPTSNAIEFFNPCIYFLEGITLTELITRVCL